MPGPEWEWIEPQYSREEVADAGRALAARDFSSVDEQTALRILNNWRASHSYPLNALQMTLRNRARSVTNSGNVVQRIKRAESVVHKLVRLPRLRLDTLQDLGGCRAVMPGSADASRVLEHYRKGRSVHTPLRLDDYIANPKTSGYRGIHLVYSYGGRRLPFKGLKIEIQIRSRLQHAWATAVETVDIIRGWSLKTGDGPDEWLEFFALAGGAFAIAEACPSVPGVPTDSNALAHRLGELDRQLEASTLLTGYRQALRVVHSTPDRDRRWFLLELDVGQRRLRVRRYSPALATGALARREQELAGQEGMHVALVAGASVNALRRGYPNYFGDTRVFIRRLTEAIGGIRGK